MDVNEYTNNECSASMISRLNIPNYIVHDEPFHIHQMEKVTEELRSQENQVQTTPLLKVSSTQTYTFIISTSMTMSGFFKSTL